MPTPPRKSTTGSVAKQFALASELPILMVAGTCIGGGAGYLLDGWLHTKPWLMLVFGAIGFAVAVRDMLRRLDKHDPDRPSQS